MFSRRSATAVAIVAGVSTLALVGEAGVAAAQPYDQGYGQDYHRDQSPPSDYSTTAPPAGQYAPPPGESYSRSYDQQVQGYDRDYARQYSGWAAQNCVDRRNTNTVAGAVIGGVLGAVIGSNLAERGSRGTGTVVGGALGAVAGGAIGNASTDRAGCPPGYVIRSGAPEFYYRGDYVGPTYATPSWYHPWTWNGSQWVYRPYRAWYYDHPNYWRSDYRSSEERDYDQGPPAEDQRDYGPPNGEYAPAPPGWRYGQSYDYRAQQYDRDYGQRYSYWAARNCVDRRNTNTVAGAVIGGVLGAVIGSNLAERGSRGEGTVVGGALGAVAGGAIGNASTSNAGCPPGYVIRAGAPRFYYNGAYYGQPYYAGPSWYQPWVWYNGHWMYRPYRAWYYRHPGYWRRGY